MSCQCACCRRVPVTYLRDKTERELVMPDEARIVDPRLYLLVLVLVLVIGTPVEYEYEYEYDYENANLWRAPAAGFGVGGISIRCG